MYSLWGSAPAGPLSSYLGTIQRNLPKGVLADTINSLADKVREEYCKTEVLKIRS
jgi:hypothetical protein